MDNTLVYGLGFVVCLVIMLIVRILKNTRFIFHKKIK